MSKSKLNTERAKRFLLSKFGPLRLQGEGIARLLEEFRTWVDPNEDIIDSVMHYAREMGFVSKSRKAWLVDNRMYLYAYLTFNFNLGPSQIGELFGVNHATIIHSLNDFYQYRFEEVKFLRNTEDIRFKYYVEMDILVAIIKAKRDGSKHYMVAKRVTTKEEMHLQMIQSITDAENLRGQLMSYDLTWKRWFLFGELKKHGWSNQRIANYFDLTARATVAHGLRQIKDEVAYKHNLGLFDTVANRFKHVTI